MGKMKIKIKFNKEKNVKDLDTDSLLIKVREELLADIIFPFIFLDGDEDGEEISKENESIIRKNYICNLIK